MIAQGQTLTPDPEWILADQKRIYDGDFYRENRWRWIFRDDCRYRRRRLRDLLKELGVNPEGKRVFDVGFGVGDLLFTFPHSCSLYGAELSRGAVEGIARDPRLVHYADFGFTVIGQDGTVPLPAEPVDIILNSHVLEHAPDDVAYLSQMAQALAPGGICISIVPVETEGFDPKHIRCYTARSLAASVKAAGMCVIHEEENYQINSRLVRWMDHPARFGWRMFGWLEGLRHLLLTPIPYRLTRLIERVLSKMGARANQAIVVSGRLTS